MNQEILTKISPILTLIGIFILLLITKIQEKNKITILTLKDSTGQIEAVLFETSKLNQIKTNKTTEIIGKLSKYNNQLQININKLKNVN